MSLTLYYLEYFAELHDDDLDRLKQQKWEAEDQFWDTTIFWALVKK